MDAPSHSLARFFRKSSEKSQGELERIYTPLIDLTFEAAYLQSLKHKDVLLVKATTPNKICDTLRKICTQVQRERKNGKLIWGGIVKSKGLYRLWVNKNPVLRCKGSTYSCKVTRIDVRTSSDQASKYGAFANMTISATYNLVHRARVACHTSFQTTSLHTRLQEIYASVIGSKFTAKYVGQKRTKSTGYWREVWQVHPSSLATTQALTEIIDSESFEGQPMSDIVWRGITSDDGAILLWVNPTKQKPLHNYKKGCQYRCTISGIDVFRKQLKKSYRAGVNIHLEAKEEQDSDEASGEQDNEGTETYTGDSYESGNKSDHDSKDDSSYDANEEDHTYEPNSSEEDDSVDSELREEYNSNEGDSGDLIVSDSEADTSTEDYSSSDSDSGDVSECSSNADHSSPSVSYTDEDYTSHSGGSDRGNCGTGSSDGANNNGEDRNGLTDNQLQGEEDEDMMTILTRKRKRHKQTQGDGTSPVSEQYLSSDSEEDEDMMLVLKQMRKRRKRRSGMEVYKLRYL